MRKLWSRFFARECTHKHTLVVTSVGVRRTICEDCGNISFKILSTPQHTYGLNRPEPAPELPHAEGL